MRAVICTKYGPPEVLQLQEIAKPIPKDHEVLIKIHATTAHIGDTRVRKFDVPRLQWIPARLFLGMMKHHKRGYRRRITRDGTIQIDKHPYYIDIKRAKQPVLVLLDAEQKLFHVMSTHEHVASKPMKGLHDEQMDFQTYLIVMKQEARSVEAHRNLLWRRRNDSA